VPCPLSARAYGSAKFVVNSVARAGSMSHGPDSVSKESRLVAVQRRERPDEVAAGPASRAEVEIPTSGCQSRLTAPYTEHRARECAIRGGR
jgi:hypothetical protein